MKEHKIKEEEKNEGGTRNESEQEVEQLKKGTGNTRSKNRGGKGRRGKEAKKLSIIPI